MFQGNTPMRNCRTLLLSLAVPLLIGAFFASPAFADATLDRIAALQERYRCPIFAYLAAIHKTPTPQRRDNRFLIIAINHRIDERYYAQCAFDDLDRKMICEVSSPFFNPELQPYFKGARLKRVTALGYHPRHKHNYFQWRDARTCDALYKIAGLLVETVGYIFDMQPDEGLIYEAPLVKTKSEQPVEGRGGCAH